MQIFRFMFPPSPQVSGMRIYILFLKWTRQGRSSILTTTSNKIGRVTKRCNFNRCCFLSSYVTVVFVYWWRTTIQKWQHKQKWVNKHLIFIDFSLKALNRQSKSMKTICSLSRGSKTEWESDASLTLAHIFSLFGVRPPIAVILVPQKY